MLRPGIHTVWSLIAIIVFVAGLSLGAYYSTEIQVFFQAWYSRGGSVLPTPDPDDISSDTSVLEMATLEAPLPLVYSDTLEEARLQEYLKHGAVVLPLGTEFGQPGNVVVTAHSSGSTAFGPYRFAFAKLSELEAGQDFTIKTPQGTYTYRVFGKEIVWPHEVDKLPQDERSTVTLVTCWPLWTNFKRLLVHGELVHTERPTGISPQDAD